MTKSYRQGQILNLIRSQPIGTQDELAHAFARLGIRVTQVTLSRDIREIGLVKGSRGYREPDRMVAESEEAGTLQRAVEDFVRDIRTAQNLLIIKTAPGNAQPVALALDRAGWPELLGTLAGDDTVFAAAPDARQALKAKEKLLDLLR